MVDNVDRYVPTWHITVVALVTGYLTRLLLGSTTNSHDGSEWTIIVINQDQGTTGEVYYYVDFGYVE